MSKKTLSLNSEEFPRKSIQVVQGKTEQESWRNLAEVTISPELAAHRVISAAEGNSGINEQIDVPELLSVLREQAEGLSKGDLKQAEAMLINQSIALQSLFARLTEKAMSAEYMKNFETYMRLALRAQSQCRTTLETLSNIKNPPIVYAKQANIAQGHQQVNNAPPTRGIENEPNQLSGDTDELRANRGAQRGTAPANSGVETLAEVDRVSLGTGREKICNK